MTPASHPRPAGRDVPETVLLVEHDVLVRSSLAQYLRGCGYRVFEARDHDEALAVLRDGSERVDIMLSDEVSGFRLSRWVRQHRPGLDVLLTGTVERAAQAAADLCEEGPAPGQPQQRQQLVTDIRRALARRAHG